MRVLIYAKHLATPANNIGARGENYTTNGRADNAREHGVCMVEDYLTHMGCVVDYGREQALAVLENDALDAGGRGEGGHDQRVAVREGELFQAREI